MATDGNRREQEKKRRAALSRLQSQSRRNFLPSGCRPPQKATQPNDRPINAPLGSTDRGLNFLDLWRYRLIIRIFMRTARSVFVEDSGRVADATATLCPRMKRTCFRLVLALVLLSVCLAHAQTASSPTKDLYYFVIDKPGSIKAGNLTNPIRGAVVDFVGRLPEQTGFQLVL